MKLIDVSLQRLFVLERLSAWLTTELSALLEWISQFCGWSKSVMRILIVTRHISFIIALVWASETLAIVVIH
jgi:hypothetical protein